MREHLLRHLAHAPNRRRWLLAIGVFALSFVPMAGTLGYFSGLILSPVLSLLGVAVGVDAVRRVALQPAPRSAGSLWRVGVTGAADLASLLGVAATLLLVGMAWNRNCDPIGGLAFFAMGPVASSVCGFVCGVSAACILPGRKRALVVGAGTLPFVAFLILGLWRLYVHPILFAYDPFWGWFSGPIYDESVRIGATYRRYRAFNLLMLSTVWLALQALVDAQLRVRWRWPQHGPHRLRLGVAVLSLCACLVIGWRSDHHGWTATEASITRGLAGTVETEHFVIHFSPSGNAAREIDAIALEHEFAYQRLAHLLGREPNTPIHSFVFDDRRDRRRKIGAGKVEVSLPWKGQMYLSHRPFPHDVLHHELAHQFLGAFGDPVLGLSTRGPVINGALIEGVPTALAPHPRDGLDLHDQAAVLDRLKKRPRMATIMGVGFWGRSSSRAYTAAGSFVAWLAMEHGWPKVGELYRNGGDFEASFGRDLRSLEKEWVRFLRARPLRDEDVDKMAQRFKRRSVFRRPCAHRVDRLRDEARASQRRGDVEGTLGRLRQLCTIEPEVPEHKLRLARAQAGFSLLEQASETLNDASGAEDLTSSLEAQILEQRGDVALLARDLGTAAAHYESALELGNAEANRRVLQVKRLAATDPALAPLVAAYFSPFAVDTKSGAAILTRLFKAVEISRLEAHAGLGHYLTGLQLLSAGAALEARGQLETALSMPEHLPTAELRRAAKMALMNAHLRQGALADATRVLDSLSEEPDLGSGDRATYDRWRERIEFFRAAQTSPSGRD